MFLLWLFVFFVCLVVLVVFFCSFVCVKMVAVCGFAIKMWCQIEDPL